MEIPTASSEGLAPDNAFAPTSVIAEHYRVERELGRGGMATVYLCTDLRDQKQVAIKVLRHELGSAVIIERFLREIAFASELDHPQIPKVLGSGVIDDVPYYVMTYIEGESLKKRLDREKQMPIADALKIACAIIEPTAYAHKRGIVHRDIKPDNILIAKDGVFVLDFGIARAIIESGGDRLTSTGIGVGTPAYMSPEQALGDRNLDVRSDIYSIGCVVYEMIAGIPPFVGPTAQVIISRRFAAPPPPLSEVRDNVPESVEDAIMKALAKSPADRWPTVSEFGDALRACTNDTRRRFNTPTIQFRRSSITVAVVAGIALMVVGGAVAWSNGRRPAVEKAQRALQSFDLATADQELRQSGADAGNARSRLWLAQVLMLRGAPKSEWRPYALFASDHRTQLDSSERLRATGLAAMASDKRGDACASLDTLYRLVQRSDAADPTPALSLADCLRQDDAILPSTASPSGYVFRASYHSAKSLYEGLLQRNANNPSAYAAIVPRLERILVTDKGGIRQGTLITKQRTIFLSLPSVVADTLAYIPYAYDPDEGIWRTRDFEGLRSAIEQNQGSLRDAATHWCEIAPESPEAHEALARVLESTGELDGTEQSALQQILIARKLRRDAPKSSTAAYIEQLRLASDEVRLNLRRNRFDLAGALADSALGWNPPPLDDSNADVAAGWLSSLAALRGKAERVISLEQKYASNSQVGLLPRGQRVTFPPRLGRDLIALRNYAAFGGPRDSILAVSDRLRKNLASDAPANERDAWEAALLTRPLAMAAPLIGPRSVAELAQANDPFVRALVAFARGDRTRALRLLDSVDYLRGDYAPGEISFDAVFQEAWLRSALGDNVGAARQLDNALRGMEGAVSGILRSPILVASLVRGMALRAELASKAQQASDAKIWATAVYSLWGNGDYITASTLNQVRRFR